MTDRIGVEALEDSVAVGSAETRRVRLWLRTGSPGPVFVRVWPEEEADVVSPLFAVRSRVEVEADNTLAFWFPDDVEGARELEPGERYAFQIVTVTGESEHLVGSGAFRTAPEGRTHRGVRFAFMSCNQPFGDDGALLEESERFAQALGRALERFDVDYMLLIGDQMYADEPGLSSLFRDGAPLSEEHRGEYDMQAVRGLYHERYRKFWNTSFGRLQRSRATYCMMDDHELIDNFGSIGEHQEPEWAAVRGGALASYRDYQGCRNQQAESLTGPFDFGFEWGCTATYVLDLRSERRPEDERPGEMISPRQMSDLEAFLKSHADRDAVFVVCTVPLVFLPDWSIHALTAVLPEGSDAHDRWNAPSFMRDLARITAMLQEHALEHPDCHVVVLGGDVHEGGAVRIGDDTRGSFLQLVSSPVTNLNGGLVQWAAHKAGLLMPTITVGDDDLPVTLVEGIEGADLNPVTQLNVGVVDVSAEGALRFRMLARDPDSEELRWALDTGEM